MSCQRQVMKSLHPEGLPSIYFCPVWWYRPSMPALGKIEQGELKYKASLGYTEICYLKKEEREGRGGGSVHGTGHRAADSQIYCDELNLVYSSWDGAGICHVPEHMALERVRLSPDTVSCDFPCDHCQLTVPSWP